MEDFYKDKISQIKSLGDGLKKIYIIQRRIRYYRC